MFCMKGGQSMLKFKLILSFILVLFGSKAYSFNYLNVVKPKESRDKQQWILFTNYSTGLNALPHASTTYSSGIQRAKVIPATYSVTIFKSDLKAAEESTKQAKSQKVIEAQSNLCMAKQELADAKKRNIKDAEAIYNPAIQNAQKNLDNAIKDLTIVESTFSSDPMSELSKTTSGPYTKVINLPLLLFINTAVGEKNNIGNIQSNLLDQSGGLVAGQFQLDFVLPILRYVKLVYEDDDLIYYGLHFRPIIGAKYIEGGTINGTTVNNFAQIEEGITPYFIYKVAEKKRAAQGTMEFGFPCIYYQTSNQIEKLYGTTTHPTNRTFFTTSFYFNLFVVNNVSIGIQTTMSNSNKDVGKTTMFNFAFSNIIP